MDIGKYRKPCNIYRRTGSRNRIGELIDTDVELVTRMFCRITNVAAKEREANDNIEYEIVGRVRTRRNRDILNGHYIDVDGIRYRVSRVFHDDVETSFMMLSYKGIE